MQNESVKAADRATFEGPAVVELMGHNMIAGVISEQTIAGGPFLRVDVPETARQGAFTKFFSASAVYAITPTDEKTARMAAESMSIRPVVTWVVPDAGRQLAAPEDDCGCDESDIE